MRRHLLAALLCSASMATSTAASAETLLFGTSNAEQHPVVTKVLKPWADAVNAEGGDAIQIEMRHGPTMVNHENYYDRVMDDVVQVVWGMTVFDPGRFPRMLVSTLPLMIDTSEQGSLALCRMHEKGAFGDETANVVPLLFVQFPQSAAHLNGSELTSMEQIAGKKIISGSPISAGIIQAYGGTPLSITITEQYQALQRGTADGTIINYTAFPGFRLNEVTTNHLDLPLGGALGLVFMARDRWDALSDDARAVLSKHSGCDASRTAGATVDQWEDEAKGFVAANGKHTFTAGTAEQVSELAQRVGARVEAGFAERVPGGADLIATFREELAAAKE
ncbi:TRAP transporter substrate-binding protein [Aquibium carbonis]|uniref:TRAP transporter substrate-binding protein n=1 Tax=Aquibium carbonis TaxID=2495581 RepID=A0A429YXL9_9HYPH|nr:TRAP transporter substrate-binding protein [Aquibium carbonis]RST86216.1 TRAP transporter substrate-binding protein [Aquibium carbonis]